MGTASILLVSRVDTGSTTRCRCGKSLRKHAYSNILNILQPKKENFQIKILIFYRFLLKHRLGSKLYRRVSVMYLSFFDLEFYDLFNIVKVMSIRSYHTFPEA